MATSEEESRRSREIWDQTIPKWSMSSLCTRTRWNSAIRPCQGRWPQAATSTRAGLWQLTLDVVGSWQLVDWRVQALVWVGLKGSTGGGH